MSALRVVRGLLLAAGIGIGLYGGYLLIDGQEGAQLRSVGIWLVGGVLLHDVLLSAAVLLVGAVVTRVLPPVTRAPIVVGAVVLGSVTLLAIPVLGRFGAKADNPTLLDRDYGTGWLVFAGLVAVSAGCASLVRLLRAKREQRPAEPSA